MNILVAGSSGFIGRSLIPLLKNSGHKVSTLVRRAARSQEEIEWKPELLEVPTEKLEQFDIFINLCGSNLASSLWTPKFRQELYESRIKPTRTLVQALEKINSPGKILVNASATGFYGPNRSESCSENSPPGHGFLSELTQAWEREAFRAQSNLTTVCCLRFGIVIGKGGMLAKMKPIFKAGLGSPIGNGSQITSWISAHDVARAILFAAEGRLNGVVNVASTNVVTNREFTEILNGILDKKSFMPAIPSWIFTSTLGMLAQETILSSFAVEPKVLLQKGFKFEHPSLEDALRITL